MNLEDRVAALEDVEAIKRLKARYAHAADAKYTLDHQRKTQEEIDPIARIQAGCFTEDAIWDGGPQWGASHGRDAIYQMVRKSVWSMTMHYFLMPHIEVNGHNAKGRWYLWQTATMTEGNRSMIMSAVTDDEYRKVEGEWLISKTVFTLKYLTPIDRPWSIDRNAPFTP